MIYLSLPRVPPSLTRIEDLLDWLDAFRREVDRALTELQTQGVSRALVGWRGAQTVASAFNIDPNAPSVVLNATFATVSSTAQAIGDGEAGQFLLLKNGSTNNITIEHGANTVLEGATAVTLTQNAALALMWDGEDWVQLAPVSRNAAGGFAALPFVVAR